MYNYSAEQKAFECAKRLDQNIKQRKTPELGISDINIIGADLRYAQFVTAHAIKERFDQEVDSNSHLVADLSEDQIRRLKSLVEYITKQVGDSSSL